MNGVGARGPRMPGPARAQNVPKTLQDRMCWACRAGDVGTRSYDDTMPIGMIAHARIRVCHAVDPAAPSCDKEEGGHVRLGDTNTVAHVAAHTYNTWEPPSYKMYGADL